MDFEEFVDYDKRYERPAEVDLLIGDPAKAKKQLDWEPKTDFKGLVKLMVEADLQLAKKGTRCKTSISKLIRSTIWIPPGKVLCLRPSRNGRISPGTQTRFSWL